MIKLFQRDEKPENLSEETCGNLFDAVGTAEEWLEGREPNARIAAIRIRNIAESVEATGYRTAAERSRYLDQDMTVARDLRRLSDALYGEDRPVIREIIAKLTARFRTKRRFF